MGKTKVPFVAVFLFIFVSSFLSSCATGKKPDSADSDLVWGYSPKSITISYQASKDLNVYDGKPHTILLCLFQLSEPNVFNELSKSDDGLTKLLECSRFDTSVAGFTRIIVQPGESKTLQLDREENAKWVGLVAGYFNLNSDQIKKLFEIPIVTKKKWLLFNTPIPGELIINLSLGSNKIQQSGGK
ncbi:MAG: type VI secretion system lipoprotein TssJ [Deltaproteobacteria bacterium]|nr:type VI secretion system lipoprotein TssJ [Deltaproteobacteria bacterium]